MENLDAEVLRLLRSIIDTTSAEEDVRDNHLLQQESRVTKLEHLVVILHGMILKNHERINVLTRHIEVLRLVVHQVEQMRREMDQLQTGYNELKRKRVTEPLVESVDVIISERLI